MKEKMTTFMAMDVLNSHMKWINMYIKHIIDHQKCLERMLEKFEIEADPASMDGESVILSYIESWQILMREYELVARKVDYYLDGRGNSNMISNMETENENH